MLEKMRQKVRNRQ